MRRMDEELGGNQPVLLKSANCRWPKEQRDAIEVPGVSPAEGNALIGPSH